jgi:hypothetical protein
MTDIVLPAFINSSVVAAATALQGEFVSAQPFPHVVIEDFFTPQFLHGLLAQFPSFDKGNSVGDDGRAGPKATFDRIQKLGPAYAALDALIKSETFLTWLGDVTGIPDLIYDPFYLGGGTHENRNSAALDAHIDFNLHPSERTHRVLNLIAYLNPRWEESWGGSLELFRDPHADARPSQSIVPLLNRCVIFETSEISWHAFNPISLPEADMDLTRRSIALYFYTRDRPKEKTAGRHTTVYVKRPLSERFQDGYTLSRGDVAELKGMLEARDGHIRHLYDENSKLLQAQDKGLVGHLLYLAKRAYVRIRR